MALSKEELEFYLKQTELALWALKNDDRVAWYKSSIYASTGVLKNIRPEAIDDFQRDLLTQLDMEHDWFDLWFTDAAYAQPRTKALMIKAHKQVISFIKKAFFSEP